MTSEEENCQPNFDSQYPNHQQSNSSLDESFETSRLAAQWVKDQQSKFQNLSTASLEVALILEKFKEALELVQSNKPLAPDIELNSPTQANHQDHQTKNKRHSIKQKSSTQAPASLPKGYKSEPADESPSKYQARRLNLVIAKNGKSWTRDDRHQVVDNFIKYFDRRNANGDRLSQKNLADEVISLMTETPGCRRPDALFSSYLRRLTLPADPVVIQAMADWAEKEKVIRGEL